MSDVADVTAICAKHREQKKWGKYPFFATHTPNFRMGDDLPADWQALIRKHFDIPPAAVVISFIGHDAVFNARHGFVITDMGLAWKNYPRSILKGLWYPNKGFFDWKALANCSVSYSGSYWQSGMDKEDIVFDQQNRFFDDSRLASNKDVYELVLDLQGWARQKLLAEQPPESMSWPFSWM